MRQRRHPSSSSSAQPASTPASCTQASGLFTACWRPANRADSPSVTATVTGRPSRPKMLLRSNWSTEPSSEGLNAPEGAGGPSTTGRQRVDLWQLRATPATARPRLAPTRVCKAVREGLHVLISHQEVVYRHYGRAPRRHEAVTTWEYHFFLSECSHPCGKSDAGQEPPRRRLFDRECDSTRRREF